MRRFAAPLLLCLLAPDVCTAQGTPVPGPEIQAAREEYERVRKLVDEGALPRKELDRALAQIEEAEDQAVLRATLYGHIEVEQLTPEQSKAMIAAAGRALDRRKERIEKQKKLIESGVAPFTSLTELLQEMDSSRKVYDQAVGRARLFQELVEMARAEQEYDLTLEQEPLEAPRLADRFDGDGAFSDGHYRTVLLAFEREFGKGLPVSARGETEFHRTMGLDHRGRIDVALKPDSREGVWLRQLLEAMRIPFFAFRGYVRGASSGAHIHIGPPSLRIRKSD